MSAVTAAKLKAQAEEIQHYSKLEIQDLVSVQLCALSLEWGVKPGVSNFCLMFGVADVNIIDKVG